MTNSGRNRHDERASALAVVRLGVFGAVILVGSFWAISAQISNTAQSYRIALELQETGDKVHESIDSLGKAQSETPESEMKLQLRTAEIERHKQAIDANLTLLQTQSSKALPSSRTAIFTGLESCRQAAQALDGGDNWGAFVESSENLQGILRNHSVQTRALASTSGRIKLAVLAFGCAFSLASWLWMLFRVIRRIRDRQEEVRRAQKLAAQCNDLIHSVASLIQSDIEPHDVLQEFAALWMKTNGWELSHIVIAEAGNWCPYQTQFADAANPCLATLGALNAAAYSNDLDVFSEALRTRTTQWITSEDGSAIPGRYCQNSNFLVSTLNTLPIFAGNLPVAVIEFASQEAKPEEPVLRQTLEVCVRLVGHYFQETMATAALSHARSELESREHQIALAEQHVDQINLELKMEREELINLQSELGDRTRALDRAEANLGAAHKALERSRDIAEVAANRFAELFQGVPVPCLSTGANGLIYEWNQAAETFFGLGATDLFERPMAELLERLGTGISGDQVLGLLASDGITEPIEVDIVVSADLPKAAILNVFHMAVAGNGPAGSVWSFSDLTAQRESENLLRESMTTLQSQSEELERQRSDLALANQKLETLATTDGLTGLKNNRAFRNFLQGQLRIAARHGVPLSLCLIDVDEFKKFNDTFGHPEGDTVLKSVAKILMDTVRESDLAARYGGEEFVVVLPGSKVDAALEAAERIREAVANHPWALRPITISVGVATYAGGSEEELVAAADDALYVSKRNGRNRVTLADQRRSAA